MTNHLFERAAGVIGWFPSGSRVICNPAPQDTDQDFVIYTDNPRALQCELEGLGYQKSVKDAEAYRVAAQEGAAADPFAVYNKFDAYRHPDNDHNLIVTGNATDYRKWRVATQVSTVLNLVNKADRIMVFRAIRSGGLIFEPPTEEAVM